MLAHLYSSGDQVSCVVKLILITNFKVKALATEANVGIQQAQKCSQNVSKNVNNFVTVFENIVRIREIHWNKYQV